MDRPFWGVDDPGMPLPFDLADIINRVESLLWRCDISPARIRTLGGCGTGGSVTHLMMGSYVLIYGLSSDFLEYHGSLQGKVSKQRTGPKKCQPSSNHKNGLYLVLLST